MLLPNLLLLAWLFHRVHPLQFLARVYWSDWPLLCSLPIAGLLLSVAFAWAARRTSDSLNSPRSFAPGFVVAIALLLLASPLLIGSGFVINLGLAGIGVLMVIAAVGVGLRLLALPWFGISLQRTHSALELCVLAGALGLGTLALLVFVCGSLGLMSPWFWWPVIVALCLLNWPPLKDLLTALRQSSRSFAQSGDAVALAAVAFLLLWLIAHLPLLWSFPLEYDVLEYHLAAPVEYLRAGHVSFLRDNIYAAFPENGEMLYLLSLILAGGDKLRGLPGAHFILYASWLLSVAGVYVLIARLTAPPAASGATARKRASALPAAALGALLYALIPLASEVLCDFYVEHIQAFFHIAALIAACAFLAERDAGVRSRSTWLVLCGGLAGLACGTKYPALLFTLLPILLFLLVFCAVSGAIYEGLQAGATVAAPAVLAMLPWLVRNFVAAGDPIYPLGLVLKQRASGSGSTPTGIDFFEVAHRAGDKTLRALRSTLSGLLPGFGALEDQKLTWLRDVESGPQVLCFAVPGVLAIRSSTALLLATVFVLDCVFWFFFTHRLNRFLYPALAPLVVLGALGIARLWIIPPLRKAVAAVCAIVVLLAGPLSLFLVWSYSRPDFITGLETPEDAARQNYHLHGNGSWFEAWREINALPTGSKVLCLGDAQTFYLTRTPACSVVFDRSLLTDALSRTDSAAAAAQFLTVNGISHIYINYPEWLRLDTSYALARSPAGNWQPARIEQQQKEFLYLLLRAGRTADYRGAWPPETYPAYLRLDAADYDKLEELLRVYTTLEWSTDDAGVPACELRRLTPGLHTPSLPVTRN